MACAQSVVYRFPFSCGKVYIGQTGRCLNDRLREHKQKLNCYRDGHVSVHCSDCWYLSRFSECVVLYRNCNKKETRVIAEASLIAKEDANHPLDHSERKGNRVSE